MFERAVPIIGAHFNKFLLEFVVILFKRPTNFELQILICPFWNVGIIVSHSTTTSGVGRKYSSNIATS